MGHEGTWEEPSSEASRNAVLLTYVLRYDELTANDSTTFRIDADMRELPIGRAPSGGVRMSGGAIEIADKWCSTRHASIRRGESDRLGEAHVITDVGSRNGTHVNGIPLSGPQRLVDGDLVEVGHTLFCYRVVDEALADALLAAGAHFSLGPTRTRCPEVAALVRDLERIAASREPVMLLGETGVGKEVAAEMVHKKSCRAGAFATIDCGAVPESLMEATFFGHRRGAFTGAAEPRTGEIVRADGGTVFLDEVGNMSLASQAKLLRVLEDGKVTPLGAAEPQKVDVRWISASNGDLFAESASFRPDLLRRLAGFVGRVPPLRRRREDLGALAAHLLAHTGPSRVSITAVAGRKLFSHPLPGNVRQLRTCLRSAAILAGSSSIDVKHLTALEAISDEETADADVAAIDIAPRPVSSRRGTPDAAAIEQALDATGGNIVRSADMLGAHPRQLYRWIERFGLDLDRYRKSDR